MLTAVLVSGLVLFATVSFAGKDDDAEVLFSIGQYLELNVTDGEAVDVGNLDPTQPTASAENGSTLEVKSNTKWSIGVDKSVTTSPEGASRNLADLLDVRIPYRRAHTTRTASGSTTR